MASSLAEMAAEIVKSHASTSKMTTEELLLELQKVHQTLQNLGQGTIVAEEIKPAMTVKEAFKKNEVICLICGKGGMRALTRHLSSEHNMKPGEYRKQFGIPRTQSLTAKSFSDARKKMAQDRGLAQNLAKARAVRAANLKQKTAGSKKKK